MMTNTTNDRMNEANKLIFVKMYEEAKGKIEELIKDPDGRYDLQIQLRRIELSIKLGEIKKLHAEFLKELAADPEHEEVWQTCVYFAEQHGELVPEEQVVKNFQDLIAKFEPSAAAYFGIAFSMECQNNFERAVYNYEQCLQLDSKWGPAYFGLSQIYYHQNDDVKGDHYFYLFEHASPYSLYGNFETHKELSAEFLVEENFEAAEAAITALSDWWVDNRGFCPKEIQIYENFSISRIHEIEGDRRESEARRERGVLLSKQLLKSEENDENIIYFVAKVLEEYAEFELAFEFYKKVLRNAGANPNLVQKIGSQFLSLGEYQLAKELFEEAYEVNPNQTEVRFCLLVSKLKLAQVNVEEYLIGRERLTKLVESQEDKVELLALLHALLAKFQDDAEVHGYIAEVYLKLGDIERAKRHYKSMFDLDGKCAETAIKFASFEIIYGNSEEAIKNLDDLKIDEFTEVEIKQEISWLKAMYFSKTGEYNKAHGLMKTLLKQDPWNVSYVSQEINILMNLTDNEQLPKDDPVVDKISRFEEGSADWKAYDNLTKQFQNAYQYELVYARQKLRYLYTQDSQNVLMNLVRSACGFDASQGVYDFLRLLNTNFDGPDIFFALGLLFKDLWQLETSSMWLEQLLMLEQISDEDKRKAYLELADSMIWKNAEVPKAIEYAKIAMDLGQNVNEKAITILAHGYLKSGQVKEAKVYLDQIESSGNKEVAFLKGLYHYRNGSEKKANELWKPLITIPNDSVRDHHIKEEMLKYYFDGAPYQNVN